MLRRKNVNAVPFPLPPSPVPNDVTGLDLPDVDLERDPLDPELDRLTEHLLRAAGTVQRHGFSARLEAEGADQPDYAEKMIGMKVREEDLGQRKAHPVAHHLALGALAALEEQGLTFAHESESANVPLDGGPSSAGPKKSHGKHGANITGHGKRETANVHAPRFPFPLSRVPSKDLNGQIAPGSFFKI